jgi:hypothetical protein
VWDRREKRETNALRDSRGVVFPRADHDETDRARDALEERRRAERRLKLRGPRARDQTESIE